ncbi:Regulator of nonsense transcripts 1 [Symbiodinium microadriaticum]|uniref:Regulator of nonsense transcripts 1 n=1 Tax=Symbiodinium microadriaticum TaxID=2951 RepID=A0A1Q9C827_SYMMI|nr:Regulator of nonsense transcripts 1 [Symbiodinium microadriaticum]
MSIWELVLVLKIYLHLLIPAGNSPNAGEADIGVISPYAAQVAQIKSAMEAEKMSFQEPDARTDATGCPEVKTVDGYQGREKEVIILSCVRTQGLGFLSDQRRLNVAITRAKSLLVVIGCAELLQTDPVWRSYINFLDRFRWTP